MHESSGLKASSRASGLDTRSNAAARRFWILLVSYRLGAPVLAYFFGQVGTWSALVEALVLSEALHEVV